jgi:hypothetical protein
VVESGAYDDLIASSPSFARLLDDVHQHESENSDDVRHDESIINATRSEKESEVLAVSTAVETKQKGTVKLNAYAEYLRAGIGIIVGIFLVLIVSLAREATYIFSSWWLATWNDDESYRHQVLNNCTANLKNNTIWNMTDTEWNNYRNRLYYIYCGLCTNSGFIL